MSEEQPSTPSERPAPEPAPLLDYSQPPQYSPNARYGSQTSPGAMDRIIPARNPKALLAYYFGVFSIVPCFTIFLSPAAIVCGILGLKECKLNPGLPGKGHAITGIVIGSIMAFLAIVCIIFIVAGFASGRMKWSN